MSDFYSTGDAVATQLQNILTQRRQESRQAMLDSLAAEKVHSDISEARARNQSLEEQRQAMAEWRRSQAAHTAAEGLSMNQDLTPDTEQVLKQGGLGANIQVAPPVEVPYRQDADKWMGLPAQRQQAEGEKQMEKFFSDPATQEAFTKMSPAQQWLTIQHLNKMSGGAGTPPEQLFVPPTPKTGSVPQSIEEYEYSLKNPKFKDFLSDKANMRDFAPQRPLQSNYQPFQDAQGNLWSFDTHAGQYKKSGVAPGPTAPGATPTPQAPPQGLTRIGTPRAGGGAAQKVDPNLLRDLTTKMGMYNANPQNAGAIAALRQAQMAIIGTYPTAASDTKALATHLIQSTDDPTEVVVAKLHAANPEVPPDQIQALQEMLYLVRGK